MGTTWRKEIAVEMSNHDDELTNYTCTLSEPEMDIEFDQGFGLVEGLEFTLWTATRVYFPVVYDGAEWCGSVSRDPNTISTSHQGG
jgi:hypothetical protein